MVIGALAMGVTYINNSKLFFGPHLLVGLGMGNGCGFSFTFSLHAKGQIGRYTHIVLNATLLALFGQALSGVHKLSKYPQLAQRGGVLPYPTLRALCALRGNGRPKDL